MSETTTITIEVPTEVLREANYHYPAKFYKTRSTEPDTGPEWLLENLARAGIIEAKEALPPARIPVPRDTENGAKIIEKGSGEIRQFIGLDPTNENMFYNRQLGRAISYWSRLDDFEVEVVAESKPAEWIPVEVGQTRLMPVKVNAADISWVDMTLPDGESYTSRRSKVESWGAA